MRSLVTRSLAAAAAAVAVAALSCGDVPPDERVRHAEERTDQHLGDELASSGLEIGQPIFIRIFKEESELEVWLEGEGGFELLRTYPVCYFSGHLGPKLREGDLQSPEGFYFVRPSQLNPNSRYHLAFNIGYPNAYDRAHGRTGGAIMVHGDCVSIGCYAMTDPGIEEIYTLAEAALNHGQPFFRVHIFPFRMTDANMRRHSGSAWYGFWENLRQGYDFFEKSRIPPDVRVERATYLFAGAPARAAEPAR
jgi:murein L,D-transpeptidase YafK